MMLAVAPLAAWLGAVASVSAWALLRPRPRWARLAPAARVTYVRPCHGAEPELATRLAWTPGSATRLAVASTEDRAHAVVTAVARQTAARVIVTGALGPNAKAEQLDRALAGDTAPIVVVADSDVAPADLVALLAPLTDSAIAAAWAPPIEPAPETLADRASAAVLDASLHAFALLGALDPGGMVGKLFAIRRTELDAIGGFGALRWHLGEDMELARRLRARGRALAVAPVVARSMARGRTAREVIARYARWLMVIRAQRPLLLASYPLLFAATLPIVLLALLAHAPVLAGLALLVRAVVAIGARLRSGAAQPLRAPAAALLADVLLWAAFLRALGPRTVTWRGRPLAIARGGLLVDQPRVSHASEASASRCTPLGDLR